MANTIAVQVLGDVSNIRKSLGSVEKQLGGFGKTAGRIGGLIKGALAGAAVGAAFKSVVSAASDAQQSLGATETVFGKFADKVIRDSKGAATQFGLSANSYRENANLIGSLFKNQGVDADKLAGKTKNMIGVASDLAATFGGDTKSAVEALGSAYKGEFDPLERYGISIKQSAINAVLAAKGQDKLTGAALKQAQQMATTSLIMKQSKDSLGAFGKESDTLAHQQQVLAAKIDNIKVAVGNVFIPMMTRAATYVSDVVLPALARFGAWFKQEALPRIQEFGNQLKANVLPVLQRLADFITGTVIPAAVSLAKFINNNRTTFTALAITIGTAVAAYKAYQVAMNISTAATKAFNAVQVAMKVIMATNPFVLAIIGIAALAAGLIYAYKHSETFREVVNGAFKAVQTVVGNVVGFIVDRFADLLTVWTTVAGGILHAAAKAFGWMPGIGGKLKKMDAAFQATSEKIIGKLRDVADSAYGWGSDVAQGFANGINAKSYAAINAAGGMANRVISISRQTLDEHSPSKIFQKIGEYVGEGFVIGIKGSEDDVAGAAEKLAEKVTTGFQKKAGDKKGLTLAKDFMRQFKDEIAQLKTVARQRAAVADKIKEAKQKVLDAIQVKDDYANSVREGIVAFASVLNVNPRTDEDGNVQALTAADLISGLTDKVQKAKEFAQNIKTLTAAGLNQTTLRQLIDAGVDSAGETATVLASAGSEVLTTINDLQAQATAAGTTLGTETANTFYTAGIQAAQGLVAGLEANADALANQATKLAKKLVKAVKKALGIKSPSRVFKQLGIYVNAGLAEGLGKTSPVERAMASLSSTVSNGFQPALTISDAAISTSNGGGGGNSYSITVQSLDPRTAGPLVTQAIKDYERTNGRSWNR